MKEIEDDKQVRAILDKLEQSKPRQELVVQHSGEIAPVSLPEVAERIAGAVQNMGADQVYVDAVVEKTANGTTARISFRAFKTKPQKGVFD